MLELIKWIFISLLVGLAIAPIILRPIFRRGGWKKCDFWHVFGLLKWLRMPEEEIKPDKIWQVCPKE